MRTLSITDINERARDIFRQIVEAYLATGEPVGSRTLSRLPGINLSPASIRNVMQDLEEIGLLSAPHTSAGRMPTELGLRLFVDGMMQVGEITSEERAQIETQVKADGGSLEDALGRATAALSGLSSCAGLVLVPKADIPIRQVDLIPLSTHRALAILVGEDGSVENRTFDLPPGMPSAALIQAANYINARLVGRTLDQARGLIEQELSKNKAELDTLAAQVVEKGLAVWSADDDERDVLIVRGQSKLIEDAAARGDLERVRQLLEDIESKRELARLLELAVNASAMKIFIGSENRLFSLSGSSVIAAPYRSADERIVGVIGVIGPTRLNYARVIPMVDYTARVLTRLVSQT
ncbi:heat-inducible transcriptional repressor HrcA [Pedomonas mirosovicensis]|uniref:heat-inducible transcriptional repressor HrcA n=1 Tax=Pedomonas mirosovicensis TaxID=2908641 RepID=UPI00216A339B|nr:heat-inducible transcriptional repressor HrcA [Pedomonas mirosovicensis]MCH8684562.1 heat-inducible transcriptional repressor HrcA [Pedomonas mirosovicensis]